MQAIPYGKQNITDADCEAVLAVLRGEYLTQGPKIGEFEKAFANYTGSRYAVAVANGTAALHLCTLALGVKEGDKVITTPITFAASANCVKYCDGEVVFADIDPETYLLDINHVRSLLEKEPKGTYTGIIPVDLAGRAVDLEAYRKLADEYGLWIISDACHSPGGFFTDSKKTQQTCGNGNFAELTVFSFHPVKHVATGEGGMITTNDPDLYRKLMAFRTHGITRDGEAFQNSREFAFAEETTGTNWPGWYMEMQALGYNYRLTDFQAALGLSQLTRADEGLLRRREISKIYNDAFRDESFIKGQSGDVEGHAYHLYVIETENRLGLYNHLRANNIFAQVHYIPCHLMPYYKQFGWKNGDMPAAENYYRHCLSLPMYPTLTPQEQEYVIAKIKEFYNA
jgi:UDP-4-amino-4,6-dideoxy-N-acetyl-beta-L-altrosamine transaminase